MLVVLWSRKLGDYNLLQCLASLKGLLIIENRSPAGRKHRRKNKKKNVLLRHVFFFCSPVFFCFLEFYLYDLRPNFFGASKAKDSMETVAVRSLRLSKKVLGYLQKCGSKTWLFCCSCFFLSWGNGLGFLCLTGGLLWSRCVVLVLTCFGVI